VIRACLKQLTEVAFSREKVLHVAAQVRVWLWAWGSSDLNLLVNFEDGFDICWAFFLASISPKMEAAESFFFFDNFSKLSW